MAVTSPELETAPRTPRQADITRAVKAVQRAGLPVVRVEICGAKIVVLTSPDVVMTPKSAVQEWLDKKNARATKGH
ncbi:hypothetical protein LG047_13455 [Methylocystis sp. WRRC1]|uniref:hypothetical protein n=1 Tax=Methylocystis sp. WRRC1 TaxID=1732014 RepID=UPI001D1365D3|nr:hypothetical protein [Methylocystis sp. WRRC1]MCC3246314.1 hypothetical protein [Methylocystis sp. WRRC1]